MRYSECNSTFYKTRSFQTLIGSKRALSVRAMTKPVKMGRFARYRGIRWPRGDLHSVVVNEELAKVGNWSSFPLHSDIIVPYLLAYGSEDQKRNYRKGCFGETIMAIGMTEPIGDLISKLTKAERDGNHFVLNGQKVWISNGQIADLYIIACKTDPKEGAKGISLILVEDRDGFKRGKNLEKIGYKAQDTSDYSSRIKGPNNKSPWSGGSRVCPIDAATTARETCSCYTLCNSFRGRTR